MKTEELRKISMEIPTSKLFYSKIQIKQILKSSMKTIQKKKCNHSENCDAEQWLNENYDFIQTQKKSVDYRRIIVRRSFADFLSKVCHSNDFHGKKDDIQSVLNEAVNIFELSEKELECLQEIFIFVILKELGRENTENTSEIPNLIRLLHQISQLDLYKIALPLSPLERILRTDPSGVYTKMTLETRSWYRCRIKHEAKKRKITPENYAQKLFLRSVNEEKHFGYFLKKEKSNKIYVLLPSFISIILCIATVNFTKSIILFIIR